MNEGAPGTGCQRFGRMAFQTPGMLSCRVDAVTVDQLCERNLTMMTVEVPANVEPALKQEAVAMPRPNAETLAAITAAKAVSATPVSLDDL